MSDFQEYPDIVQEVRGALNPGRIKLQSDSVVFKNIKTGKVDQFQGSEVEAVQWLKRARGFCLKISLTSGIIHRYDGFKEGDYDKLASFVSKNYETKLEKVDLSTKGWNWGIAKFEGNALNFSVDNNLAFEIPLNNVSHTTTAKNEVTLEFHQNDDAAVSLMELRFHIPTDSNTDKDLVQDFHDQVMDKADIIQATGNALTTFSEVQCLTPRGRYDIKIYPTFLQLHGKTFDYKIPYTTVLRLFLLPHKDGRQIFFVVSLDPPIKQGQTRYHFLILLFYKDDEMTLELDLTDEELETKYEGKLAKEMSGFEYEIVSRIFKAVTNRKITVPGSFKGHSGTQAISCSYKAATGLLYPLERGFMFLHKPPVHVRFDEVATVNFARSAGSTRSFDFDVETKLGNVYTFSSIEKDEYGKLYDFVKGKKLRVKNIGKGGMGQGNYDDMLGSDEEDTHDAYLERMKAEGQDRDSDDLDDESDSSDESFNPGESGSEVAEEYDSNPPTSDSDSDYSAGSAAAGSGADSEEEEKRRERKEKREKRKEEKERKRKRAAKTEKEGGAKKSKKKSKNKDPNRPKRPPTAYFLWFMENREKIKEDIPGASVVDISKKAGELWKEVTDKSEYEKKAEEAKVEYKEKLKEYEAKLKEEGYSPPEKAQKSSKKKSPKKSASESRAGSGANYKSKEYISSSESSSSSDDDKPLKKRVKKEKATKKEKKERKEKKEESEAEGELPEDEEILSTPPSSPKSGGGGEEEVSGSEGGGSDSD